MGNAFEKKIKKTDSTATSKTKIKVAAEVNDQVKEAVDKFVNTKANIKSLESKLGDLQTIVIAHVKPQQDELGFAGNFTGSMTVAGNTTSVLFIATDKFSVPQDEGTLSEIKKLIGDKKYDEFFEVKKTISLKSEVVKDDDKLNQIAEACEKAGLDIGQLFDMGEKVIARPGLDEKIYSLPRKILDVFRSLVKQASGYLK